LLGKTGKPPAEGSDRNEAVFFHQREVPFCQDLTDQPPRIQLGLIVTIILRRNTNG
jgi:hypothetical protein